MAEAETANDTAARTGMTLFQFADSAAAAQVTVALLEAHGIPAWTLDGEHLFARLLPMDLRVYVPASRVADARRVVHESRSLGTIDLPPLDDTAFLTAAAQTRRWQAWVLLCLYAALLILLILATLPG